MGGGGGCWGGWSCCGCSARWGGVERRLQGIVRGGGGQEPPCSCLHSKRPACPAGQRSASWLGARDHQAAYQEVLAGLLALPGKYYYWHSIKLTKSTLRRTRKKTKPEQIQAVWRASPAPPGWSPWSWTCTSPGTLEHQRESQRTEVHGDALLQLLLHGCDCGFLLQLLLVSMMPSCCEALVPRKRVFKTNVFQN